VAGAKMGENKLKSVLSIITNRWRLWIENKGTWGWRIGETQETAWR